MEIDDIIADEELRRTLFPVTAERVFMAHAGVAPLPKVSVDAIAEFCARGSRAAQENAWSTGQVLAARQTAARLLGCAAEEIALLGPTSLGLSLVANGIPWRAGEEVIYYPGDYPANVYPWTHLAELGVKPVALQPEQPGVIEWDLVEAQITPRTRLVSLASCNFLSGYRIDIDSIGRNLRRRGILFCVDGIQTLGAFPMSVEPVDFVCADSHKWMLGPCGAGIVYVSERHHELVRPTLLGSCNVVSPHFIAQSAIRFEHGARRYEPGALNLPGILGMGAALRLLLELGIERVGTRILNLRRALLEKLRPLGFETWLRPHDEGAGATESTHSGIVTVTHPTLDMKAVFKKLDRAGVTASLRQNSRGVTFVRFSPHFYNTFEEIDRIADVLSDYA
ncbi:MAG: aminotransferase [Candidatus Hydrogenedentota bacterium]